MSPTLIGCGVGAGFDRRIQPFAPTDLPNLVGWWRGDLGVTDAGGGLCSAWANQGSLGGTLTSAVGERPAIDAANSLLGGQPALVFDGANDRLVSSLASSNWKFIHNGTGATVALIMGAPASIGSGAGYMLSTQRAVATRIGTDWLWSASDIIQIIAGNGSGTLLIDSNKGANIESSKNILLVRYGATSITPRLNGVGGFVPTSYTGSPSSSDPFATLTIGHIASGNATDGWEGPIGEVMIWNRELSDAEIVKVEKYANKRYGIVLP